MTLTPIFTARNAITSHPQATGLFTPDGSNSTVVPVHPPRNLSDVGLKAFPNPSDSQGTFEGSEIYLVSLGTRKFYIFKEGGHYSENDLTQIT